jgi:Flp pilus assembly protein TadG
MARHLLSRLHILRSDRDGTVLVEFAVAFPVMLGLFIGSYTVSDAIACNRKVTVATRALTDLATRYSSMTESDVTTIFNAAAQILYPYDASKASIVLSEVQVTSSTQAKVVWSRAQNGTPQVNNAIVTIPTGIAATGTYLIVGQFKYSYTSSVKFGNYGGSIALSDTIVMLPRISEQVPIT